MDLMPREADCPSDYALDMLRAELLPAAEAAQVQGHVDGCAECAARLQAMRVGFDAEPDIDPRALLAGARRRAADVPQPWWTRWRVWLPAMALGAAAAIALVVMRPAPPVDDPRDGVRFKGDLVLRVVRATPTGSEEVISGARFAAGDRLRFRVDLPTAGHVAIIGVDAAGEPYTAWPLGDDLDDRLDAGGGQLLAGAIGLDDAPGRETLHLVLCPDAPPRCAVVDGRPDCPEGCRSTPFVLDKGP